jgi:hypothetical protein
MCPVIRCRLVIRKTRSRRAPMNWPTSIRSGRNPRSLPVAGKRLVVARQRDVSAWPCRDRLWCGKRARIKSCDDRPLKRLSLIAFEHIGTQEIRGMLILVCALTLALAIGACVGALMVRLRADKVALVRRDAVSGLNGASPRRARRQPQRPTEPPASRS